MAKRVFDGLWEMLPGRCAVCARWPSKPVCGPCVQRFAAPQARCRLCALPVHGSAVTCGACLKNPPPLSRCVAAVDYGYPWSSLVAQFKFHGQPGWAGVFAGLMSAAEGAPGLIAQCDLVLALPLSGRRLAERGFNQSHELARRLAPRGRLGNRLLLRTKDTPPQATLGLEARKSNVHSAFAVDPLRTAEVKGRSCLLVDDVMTSGASLHAAARALAQAGAARVDAIVLARTPG